MEELQRDVGVLLRRRAQLQVQAPPRLLFERAARGVGIQQEGVQHHVVVEAARLDAQAAPVRASPTFTSQAIFDCAGILQPRLQVRRNARHAPRAPRRPARPGRWCPARTRLPPISRSPPPPARPAASASQACSSSALAITLYCRSRVSSLGPSSLSRLWNSISL